MNLSEATDEQKIKALAELDGWRPIGLERDSWYYTKIDLEIFHSVFTSEEQEQHRTCILPKYLTSYDAIIPLVHGVINRHTCHSFFDALGLIAIVDWQEEGAPSYNGDGSYFELWVLFKATPSQLCDALLVATGKFEL